VYAAVALRMAESGDWMSMWLGAEPYFNKPPLLFWLTAALFRALGPSTWTACFWSAAFGAAACVALYRLARELFDRPSAFCAACVLLSTYDFLSFATRFRLESVCALLLVLALRAGVRAVRARDPRPLAWAGLWLGLCFMAKGGPGFIGLASLLAYVVWSGAGALLASRAAARGALALLALAGFWPLAQWWQHGDAYLAQAIGAELVDRLTGDTGSSRSYAGVIVERYWPWLPFLLLGTWRLGVRERRERREAFRLLAVWIGTSFAALSLTDFPYGRYLSSVWPAFALVAGHWIARALGAVRVAWAVRALPVAALAASAATAVLPVSLHQDRAASARRLGELLALIDPGGREVVSYRESHPFWHGQLYFTCRRELRVVATRDELARDPARLVISRREAAAELEADGWLPLLRGRRWTAYLRPPPGPAPPLSQTRVGGRRALRPALQPRAPGARLTSAGAARRRPSTRLRTCTTGPRQ
jgi:4-amino-4-deoxy-L-arabinose transferase-like glycosyltransferase